MNLRFIIAPKLILQKEPSPNFQSKTLLTWNPFSFSYDITENVKISETLMTWRNEEGDTIFNPKGKFDNNLGLEKIKRIHHSGVDCYVLEVEKKSPIFLLLTPEGKIREKLNIPISNSGWPITSSFYHHSFLIITRMWCEYYIFKKQDNDFILQEQILKQVLFNSYVVGNPHFLLNTPFGLELCRVGKKELRKLADITSKKLSDRKISGFLDVSTLRIFMYTDTNSSENCEKSIFEVWQPITFHLKNEKYEFKLIQSLEREKDTKFYSFDSNFLYLLYADKLEVLIWQDGRYIECSQLPIGTSNSNIKSEELRFEDFQKIAKKLEHLCPLPLVLLVSTLEFL